MKFNILRVILLIFTFISINISAQIDKKDIISKLDSPLIECGFDHLHKNVKPIDYPYDYSRSNEIFNIPVVVHIIHKGENIGQGTNISESQVQSAIIALNEDYRKIPGTNGDGLGVDTEIEFCLAVRDPDGNPSTGINRVDGTSIDLYENEGITAGQGSGANELDIKNLSRWPNTFAYNIWVVSEIEDNDGGAGIQGYAYFPTTNPKDGTVILYNSFGTEGNLKSYTNMGRTLTHELGHGLNLYHTFQGQSCTEGNCETQGDRVCDTPPTTLNSNCNSLACSGTQQVENYLDYTGQTCKNTFTQGQRERMRASILGSIRSPLLESLACVAVNNIDAGISDIIYPANDICSNQFNPNITLSNYGTQNLSIVEIIYGNNLEEQYIWTGNLSTGESINIVLPLYNSQIGTDISFSAKTDFPNSQSDQYTFNDEYSINYSVTSGVEVYVTITTDFYGNETTWDIKDDLGEVIANGGPYPNGQIGTQHEYILCIEEGCYDFTIYDSQGDGICCSFGLGGYEINDIYGNTLVSGGGTFSDSNTFEELTINFCAESGDLVDCNEDINGTAYIDECGDCVEGNTGLEPCIQDCNGVYGGNAFIDECGDCVEELDNLWVECPSDTTVQCYDDIPASLNINNINYNNNCLDINIDVIDTEYGFTCNGYIERLYTIYDINDTVTCLQVISYNDTVSPVFNYEPEDIIVSCGPISYPNDLYASDNCNIVSINYSEEIIGSNDTINIYDAYSSEYGLILNALEFTNMIGNNKYEFQEESILILNSDGTAKIQGTVLSTIYDEKGWDVEINLKNKSTYDELIESNGIFEPGLVDLEEFWSYYDIADSSKLTGILDYEGFYLNINPMLIPEEIVFQIGDYANTINSNYGAYVRFNISGYFDYNNVYGSGRIYLDTDEISSTCNYTILREWSAQDECGNISTVNQEVLVESCGDNGLSILDNPYSDNFCELSAWGTDSEPYTIGYPCITNASYYSKTFNVEPNEILDNIIISACELNTRDIDNNLRNTFHNYFWFDGDCVADDLELLPGIAIYDSENNLEYYINRNEFALEIEEGDMIIENLELSYGEYEIRVIHDEPYNIGWNQDIFYDYHNFGECLDLNGFIAGNIWLTNTFVANSYNGLEVILDDIEINIVESPGNYISNNISNNIIIDNILIYPNPSNGNFNIINNNKKDLILEIYSITGQIIDIEFIRMGINKIDISEEIPGIYIIDIEDMKPQKIILMK